MKLLAALVLGLSLGLAQASEPAKKPEGETKDVKVGNKTQEVRVPKSAKIDCKVEANKDKTECKKQPKEMPKIDKPVVKEEPKKESAKK
jgi:hypothetical protein